MGNLGRYTAVLAGAAFADLVSLGIATANTQETPLAAEPSIAPVDRLGHQTGTQGASR